jgi:hypothetical protein
VRQRAPPPARSWTLELLHNACVCATSTSGGRGVSDFASDAPVIVLLVIHYLHATTFERLRPERLHSRHERRPKCAQRKNLYNERDREYNVFLVHILGQERPAKGYTVKSKARNARNAGRSGRARGAREVFSARVVFDFFTTPYRTVVP